MEGIDNMAKLSLGKRIENAIGKEMMNEYYVKIDTRGNCVRVDFFRKGMQVYSDYALKNNALATTFSIYKVRPEINVIRHEILDEETEERIGKAIFEQYLEWKGV